MDKGDKRLNDKRPQNGKTAQKPKFSPRSIVIFVRFLIAAICFIAGFNFSNTLFFHENPLFGVPFLAELLVSTAAALFGFSILPNWAIRIKAWFEWLVESAVRKVVSDFWSQQAGRMQQAQRDRQKRQKLEHEQKTKQTLQNNVLLDTSVLIDGRVLLIAKTGFLDTNLVITQPVLGELHLVSDSSDVIKRQKGRRGLDIAKELKKYSNLVVFKNGGDVKDVDKYLVAMAKKFKMKLMTVDFNLNKLAKVEGVAVLNVNDLVEAVKPAFLPGEQIKVKIVHEGKEKQQGIGYLEDGTMLVVEDAKTLVGETVDVKVSKVIQSPAGKMVFCSLLVQ
ncbi:MAG: PIN/TRAM domain protein [candidate division WWE3 bacterium GW2011_GWB1_47_11]|uniref:PIN/TRAM domain protein n=1 Tax=candidate division WWE3 bacterium GW2011_GWB1_47_11 TaxID=1619117 RepID=A0A0G1RKC8_UNCKA|nr:MAG: PIN/TRAM domain protein [candidate division WWE3 bacterium GW2011_GWB1_47_11]